MKRIETQGITYIEPLVGCNEWYWGTDYIHGDLYEAEELFRAAWAGEPLDFTGFEDQSDMLPGEP